MTANPRSSRTSAERRSAPKPSKASPVRPNAAGSKVVWLVVVAVVAVGGLFALYTRSNQSGGSTSTSGSGKYAFQVGDPGPGQSAPPIHLTSATGSEFDLAGAHGKTVLLYFQEGVGCQPCFDQIKTLEKDPTVLNGLGVDELVSITGSGRDQIAQKVSDMGLSTPVLSDPDLAVSKTYHANDYGMMGTGADGHTFILVGPDGTIRWRADYGGKPNYTMFVPVDQLVADLSVGLNKS